MIKRGGNYEWLKLIKDKIRFKIVLFIGIVINVRYKNKIIEEWIYELRVVSFL